MLKFIKSFKYAFEGLITVFKSQNNFKVHVLATIVVSILGYILHISAMEWAILFLTCGVVLSAEAINTSLEFLTDLVTTNHHHLAKKTKDTAAAAVIILAFFAICIFFCILFPKIIVLIK
jgi:undecaprenol kinase